jgi:hypothetical protein
MADEITREFLRIFRAEIEGSMDDFQYLIDSCDWRLKNGEITQYVYNENTAFLTQAISGLRRFLAFVDSVSPDVQNPADIASLIGDVIQKKMKDYEDPEAVYKIVNTKLEKTLRFLKLR